VRSALWATARVAARALHGIVAVSFLAGPLAFAAAEPPRPQPPKGGVEFQSPDVRALQADDFANPISLWIARGEGLWAQARGAQNRSCAGCHGDAKVSMKGVAARYPRHDPSLGRVVNLEQRIQACSDSKQGAGRFVNESDDLIGIAAYLALQSRGTPVAVAIDGPARPVWEAGRNLFFTRIGQMNLACTQCHDANWGRRLLADTISQGHPTGWPAYRLEWQRPGTLGRRLRACFNGVRAEMPAYGAPDLVALELYLAWRAAGLPLEAPGVRR
jgi:sulfur-oxidizing protein SoxA